MKRAALVLVMLSLRVARADDTAALAYRQAEDLAKQGKYADACPLYEASYRADPQIGVLLHLADCHEHVGRLASAWAEFNDAVELAHRRGDNRESLSQQRADALKPKLAYLHLAPPPAPIAGLAVQRDGLDVTVLVGSDVPIDPGEHEIVATAPGYVEWRKKLTIAAAPGTTPLAIPALDKPAAPPVAPVPPPKAHEGTLDVKSQADAHIALDSNEVGVGAYKGKVRSGGHQLRVTAPGMRPYQSEVFVADDETRTIDVPLEKEAVAVIQPQAPAEDLPRWEAGASLAPGSTRRADNPGVIAYRLDIGLRLGAARRVNFGLYSEYSSIQASGSCGTNIPGPMSTSPLDYGVHNQFQSCKALMAGLQVYVHILPKQRIDPYFGIAPGFQMRVISYVPYDATGQSLSQKDQSLPGIFAGGRAGVDYHPLPTFAPWAVGAFLELDVAAIAQQADDNSGHKNDSGYLSMFGGLRTSLTW